VSCVPDRWKPTAHAFVDDEASTPYRAVSPVTVGVGWTRHAAPLQRITSALEVPLFA
jgi:hypothetical protein